MSNPLDNQGQSGALPDIVQSSIAMAATDLKAAEKDKVEAVAGESTGGVDIEALALRVFALLREEVRVERERSIRS